MAVEVRVQGKPSVEQVRQALDYLRQRRLSRYDAAVRAAVEDARDEGLRDERVSA